MADRSTFNGASTNVPWQDTAETPEGFGNQYARHIKALYDASALPLTSVGGTGDNVTATVDPSLPPGGLRDGMKFGITWTATNSGPMTLTIAGASAAPVLSADGAVADPGLAALGGRALLEYVGGAFRVLSGGAGSGGAARHYWQFTASGTWTKPSGLPDDTMVTVEMWGGGGSGGRNSNVTYVHGGGGGGYTRCAFRAADLPSTVPIAIGSGGAARTSGNTGGETGGNTTFGLLLTAYGGGAGGGTSANYSGGGGGGEMAAGASGQTTADVFGGLIGGGDGRVDPLKMMTANAKTIFGGAGGGQNGQAGGAAVFGGGGGSGGGSSSQPGGGSLYGGRGGDAGQAGYAPGGGGGAGNNASSGAGARGEVRIWI